MCREWMEWVPGRNDCGSEERIMTDFNFVSHCHSLGTISENK